MAIERKSANTKSTILEKAKNANTKLGAKAKSTKTAEVKTTKAVKKGSKINVRKKLTEEEIKESEKAKSALNVNLNSPLLSEEKQIITKEKAIDPSFTQTQDGEDLKSLNIGRIKKNKKKKEEELEEEKIKAKELEERKKQEELEEKAILDAARKEYEESQKEKLSPNQEITPEEYNENLEKKIKERKVFAWNITIKPFTILMASLVAFIGLGIFFTFGIIVGRDLTPAGQAVALETISATNRNNPTENTEVLKPEELQYAELKIVPATEEEQEVVQVQMPDGTIITGTIDPTTGAITPLPLTEGATITQAEAIPVIEEPQVPLIYDFSLRAASFKEAAQADSLRQRLEGDGMRTQLITEKVGNTTWYYVHINFRGNEENFNTMRSSLNKYRISGTILKSKTEVK